MTRGGPHEVTCSISHASLALSGSAAQANVTVTTLSNTPKGSFKLTLTATSGVISHKTTVTLTLTVN